MKILNFISVLILLFIAAFLGCNHCDGDDGRIAIIYVSASGHDVNPGPQSEPKLIQSAVNAATASAQVCVAEGMYETSDQITMRNGMSILGGYSEDFSGRDTIIIKDN